jgi:hypothetical protein
VLPELVVVAPEPLPVELEPAPEFVLAAEVVVLFVVAEEPPAGPAVPVLVLVLDPPQPASRSASVAPTPTAAASLRPRARRPIGVRLPLVLNMMSPFRICAAPNRRRTVWCDARSTRKVALGAIKFSHRSEGNSHIWGS